MKIWKTILVFVFCLLMVILSLSLGTITLSPWEVVKTISGAITSVNHTILINVRIPRIIMSLIIGASLSVSGVIFQAILRNSLADPYVIGVSGGGALGASIAIIFSFHFNLVVLFAFTGSFLAVTLVYLISRRMKFGTTSLILTGIALSFIFSSSVLLLFALAEPDKVHRAINWLMGDLSTARIDFLEEMGIVSFVLIGVSLFFHRHLNVISFGEAFSKKLGVSKISTHLLFWIASMLAAISVSMCGVIGFIGLIVPHMMRALYGPHHRVLLPASALVGAFFLMSMDTIGRSIAPPYEIPVGVITGFVGGLFFIILMVKKKDYSA